MTYMTEIVRDPIYYGIIPSPTTMFLSVIVSLGSLAIGWIVFRHMAPHFHAHL
jgi:ABC-type polysaccharide/polyol phosphate export permease